MASLDAIAQEVGLHPTTVSRILKSEETYKRPALAKRAEKVKAVADRMGYRPNLAARAVALQRFNTLALLQHEDTTRSNLPGLLLDGVQAELGEHDMQLCLSRLREAELEQADMAPKVIKELNADGLLINMHSNANRSFEAQLEHYRVPAIWLNHKREHDCVYLDDQGAAEELTQYFLYQGIECVAYVGFGMRTGVFHYSKQDRVTGYEAAMDHAGLSTHSYLAHHPEIEAMTDFISDLRRQSERIAIIGYGSHEVETVLHILWQRLGIAFKDDIQLAMFQEGRNMKPFLSAFMESPLEQLGRTSVAHMMKKVQQPTSLLDPEVIPWNMVIND